MLRRHYLAGAGLALSATVGGCVANDPDDDSRDDEEPNESTDGADNGNSRDDSEPGDGSPEPDLDAYSIDGRLTNKDTVANTFTVTISTEDGATLIEEDESVPAGETVRVPGLGRPGTSQTITVDVDGQTTSETLDLNVEPTPEKVDGFIDVTYVADGPIQITFTPRTDFDDEPGDDPDPDRGDTPPHRIESQDRSDRDSWNEDYLGEHMATEPSLEFDVVSRRRGIIERPQVDYHDTSEVYWVSVIEDAAQRDAILDLTQASEETQSRLESFDFDEQVLVAVENGFGSGSVDHRWARIEESSDGLHLHGYLTDPYAGTDDITTWVSVIAVDRPSTSLDLARVSMTVDPERRVTFDSTEGAVTVDR